MIRLMVRQALLLTMAGICFGLAVAVGVMQIARSLLSGVSATDPLALLRIAGAPTNSMDLTSAMPAVIIAPNCFWQRDGTTRPPASPRAFRTGKSECYREGDVPKAAVPLASR